MVGGWNYKRLRNLAHKYKNISHMEDEKSLEDMDRFPTCRGTFDTCPSEEELNGLLKSKKAPSVCGKCPVFAESDTKGITTESKDRISQEDLEFYKNLFGK